MINVLVGPVCAVVVVEDDLFVRRVEGVAFLPVHVGHPDLFPREQVLERAVMGSDFQYVSVAEGKVS